MYLTDASTEDPVIEAAGAVQTWLVRGVDSLGVWPLLAILAALLATTVGLRILVRHNMFRRSTRPSD
ncbi:hypothetical protein A4G28_12530 [Mycobacterium ostraviense]|uniref:Transmembrane protein n=1 Tax=Mycobacterium ostraviense TaxID=2738409 RepID=A0A164CHZ9_9MYCO|nr:hypothetical protein A4G28_12530 [Mycobacterium ostraviense]